MSTPMMQALPVTGLPVTRDLEGATVRHPETGLVGTVDYVFLDNACGSDECCGGPYPDNVGVNFPGLDALNYYEGHGTVEGLEVVPAGTRDDRALLLLLVADAREQRQWSMAHAMTRQGFTPEEAERVRSLFGEAGA